MSDTPSTEERDDPDLWEHEVVIRKAGLMDEKSDILSIVNGLITAGIKLANDIDYRSLDMQTDYDKKWNMIDAKKLPYVKRLCSLLNDHATTKASEEAFILPVPYKLEQHGDGRFTATWEPAVPTEGLPLRVRGHSESSPSNAVLRLREALAKEGVTPDLRKALNIDQEGK